jgi:hypothetical protein
VLFVQQKCLFKITIKEEFEDTKGIIIILKSKDRQYNDQNIKDKRQRMISNLLVNIKVKYNIINIHMYIRYVTNEYRIILGTPW